MTLSDLSIKRPVFAWMLMVGLIVFGWIGFRGMGISQLPDVDFPVVNINVTLEGAAPEIIETQVTDVIEDAIMSVQGIRDVSSSSRQGQANITIEFELNRDIDVALQEVQTKIAQAQKNLPKEIDPPVVTKSNPEDQPIMWVSLSGDVPLRELMSYTHDVLKDQLTAVPGVAEIFLGGYVEPNLRVWLNAKKMDEKELSVQDVMTTIQMQHQESPAGYIDTGTQEKNVRVMGEVFDVESFKNLAITQRGGAAIWKTFRLKDVAEVEDGLNDVRRISRLVQIPAVGLGIKKQRGSNAVAVAQAVKAKVEEINKTLPPKLKLKPVFDTTKFIEESTDEMVFTLILSAILTSLVCFLFLGSLSSTLNVLLAIPTSIIGSFLILYFMGFTLNTFTLLGLALAIGIVVDDAIMVLENIVRYREEGFSRVRAALVGAREITFAALAASVAILAIFIPVVFMKGILGKFFYQFGITMSVAVLLSLLEALTLAPMRCSQYLTVGSTSLLARGMDRFMEGLTRGYAKALGWSLRHRGLVLLGSTLIFAFSLVLLLLIPSEMIPAQDQGRFLARIQTPVGSSMKFTDSVVQKIEKVLAQNPAIEQYYVAIGGFGGSEVNVAQLFITLKPLADRPPIGAPPHPPTQMEIMKQVREELSPKKIPGIFRVAIQDPSLSAFSAPGGGGGNFPVSFNIRGSNWEELSRLANAFREKMSQIQTDQIQLEEPSAWQRVTAFIKKRFGSAELSKNSVSNQENSKSVFVDVDTDYKLGMPELQITPNREKAAAHGVNVASIGDTINAMIGGIRVGKYTQNGKRYDIRARLVSEDRNQPEDLTQIWVRNNRGEKVALSELVDVQEKPTLLSITRRMRERAISITANMGPNVSQADALREVEQIQKEILPSQYKLYFSGSAQTFKESNSDLMFALLFGIFVAYMVLASQFNSFIHPFTVLLALPFSLIGALIALKIGKQSLNIYSMIGIILLMGIVKKNSILLVDFTNERRKTGRPLKEALLEACPIRLRPILMTSIATIAGALPPALGLGPGAETRIPMALVVIGGVFTSTFLTLFVVPCAYSLMSRFESHKHDADLKEALIELGELPRDETVKVMVLEEERVGKESRV